MKVVPYEDLDAVRWDDFVARAFAGTFLHTRRFLSYHGDRFRDVSLLLEDEKNSLVGVFPAAVEPADEKQVTSHPGVSYGGLLHAGSLRGEKMLEAFDAVRNYYCTQGFETLRYKAVPYIYHRVPAMDDLYALFRQRAVRYRCDLSCAIDLWHQLDPSERRKRGLKKAQKQGVQVERGPQFAAQLWPVLEVNLDQRHGVHPVHSLHEILHLQSLFPGNIGFTVVLLDGKVVAGVVVFLTSQVVHAQYIASSAAGSKAHALDALFEHCIEDARTQGARYFDFGISNEDDGQYLNVGLYQFKAEFGGGGVVHDFYEINLRRPEATGDGP